MAKKILAILSALALTLCAVCVFTVAVASAKSAPFAGDEALYKPALTDFVANDGGWINKTAPETGMASATNADGSIHLYANNHSTKRFYYETTATYAADADGKIAEVVIDNVTTGGCDRFTLYLNGENGFWLSFCGDGSVLKMCGAWGGDQSGTVDNAQAVIDMLDGAMTRLTVKKSGDDAIVDLLTEGGEKATATFTGALTGVDTCTIGFGQWSGSGDDKYAALDVCAIHGANQECGDRPFRGDIKNYKPVVTDFVDNNSGWINKTAPETGMASATNADGSVHLYANNHPTCRFYYATTKSYKADASGKIAEVIIDNVTTGACDRFTLYLNGENGFWLSFCGDGSVLKMCGAWGGDQSGTIDNAQAVIDMLDGAMTRLTVKKSGDDAIVDLLTEGGEKATATFTGALTGVDTCTIGFGQWNGSGDDKYAALDVYAIHGADELCADCGYYNDAIYNAPAASEFATNNASWNKNGEATLGDGHWITENADGSLHFYNKGHTTACLGYRWRDGNVKIDGLHMVIGPVSWLKDEGNDGNHFFGLQMGPARCKQESGSDWAESSGNLMYRIITSNGENAGKFAVYGEKAQPCYPFGAEPLDIVKHMETATTVFEFAIVDGALEITLSNSLGETAKGTIPAETMPDEWTDPTTGYFYIYGSNTNTPYAFDLISIHDGSEPCADAPGFVPMTEAAKAVIDAIDALGEITLESKDAVNSAVAAYDALSKSDKKLVSNYAALQAAEKVLGNLIAQSLRKTYPNAVKVGDSDLTVYAGSFDTDTWDKDTGALIDCFAPAIFSWGTRVAYPYAVGVDGLQIVLKNVKRVKNAIAIGLMNEAGMWVDEPMMVHFRLFAPNTSYPNGAVHATEYTGDLNNHTDITKSFDANIFEDDTIMIEFYLKDDGDSVAVLFDGEYMGDMSLTKELGIADKDAVYVHFGFYDGGDVAEAYSVYSITSASQAEGIKAVEDLIDAIGEVTLDSEAAIEEAQAAYKALAKNLRSYVSNYEVLTAAQARLEELQQQQPTSEPATTEEPVTETEEPTSEEPIDYVAIVRVEINPTFDLYVDAEGNVVDVKPLNADAESIIDEISFENLTVAEVVNNIIEEAVEAEFLTEDNCDVEITVYATEEATFDPEVMVQEVEHAVSEKVSSMELSFDVEVKIEVSEEPLNPKTGEAVAVLPIAMLIVAAGAVLLTRKRKSI